MNDCAIDCANQITRRTFLKTTGTVALFLYEGYGSSGISRDDSQERAFSEPDQKRLAEEEKNYYILKKDDLLEQFDEVSESYRKSLITRFDEVKVDTWRAEARQQYEALIPQLPYVGGDKNRLTRVLLITSTFIPFLKILRNENVSTRKNGKMIFKLASDYYHGIFAPVKWYLRWDYFRESTKQAREAAAKLSQLRRYPGDWVFEFVEGDGKSFDYGVNYTECALKKLWTIQGLEEFVPYLCLCDYALWRAIGMEVARTQTLANGGFYCDFRYVRKGSNGISGWPPESVPEWTGKYEI